MAISPRSDCALIRRLLYTWPYPFRLAAFVLLRKRKTITQRRKSSEEGARHPQQEQHPGTGHTHTHTHTRHLGRTVWSGQSQG